MHNKVLIVFFVVVISLTACEKMAIVHDLSERDASEIIVLLNVNGVKAEKIKEVRNQEVFWSVSVSPSDEITAQNILVANQLPRVRQGGLEGSCKNTSMIVTKDTEKCRMLLAMKGEIINSLQSIPGVSFADVVLNIPDKEEFPDPNVPQPRPSASVTLRLNKDVKDQTPLSEGKVQEFVANSISGMDARDVAVIISYVNQGIPKIQLDVPPQTDSTNCVPATDGTEPTQLVSVGGIKMAEKSAIKFKIVSVLFMMLLLLLAGAFIFTLLKMSKLRKQAPVTAEPAPAQTGNKLLQA